MVSHERLMSVPWDVLLALTVFVVLLFTGPPAFADPLTTTTKFDLGGTMSAGYRVLVSTQGRELSAAWGTGAVQFGQGGIPVFYVSAAQVQADCWDPQAIACHGDNGSQIYILAQANLPRWMMEYALDHEILETMVDPYPDADPTFVNGQLAEVCDPVENRPIYLPHYTLSRFVGPSYFNNH